MTAQTQAEALRLSQFYEKFKDGASVATAAELRRLHAENERIGAAHAADYAKLQGYLGALNAADARIAELEAQAQPAREPPATSSSPCTTPAAGARDSQLSTAGSSPAATASSSAARSSGSRAEP